eukprot:1126269-Rhodomonas_salina.1
MGLRAHSTERLYGATRNEFLHLVRSAPLTLGGTAPYLPTLPAYAADRVYLSMPPIGYAADRV